MTTIITIACITIITFTAFTVGCMIATMAVPYDKRPDWVDNYVDKLENIIMR